MSSTIIPCDQTTATECPICMEAINSRVNCVITECGHQFHTKCLLTNVAHNGFGCPYCRTEMIDDIDDDEDEEEENDRLNTGLFWDDDDDDADSWRPPNDDDDDDDDDVEEARNDYALLGMRMLFAFNEGENIEEESTDDDDDETDTSDDEDERDHRIRTDFRVTEEEIISEESRMLNGALPSVRYIIQRFMSTGHGEHSYEEISQSLTRLMLCQYFPQYETIIQTRIIHRIDYNLINTINQIISEYQVYEHDDLVQSLQNASNVDQAVDMGMD